MNENCKIYLPDHEQMERLIKNLEVIAGGVSGDSNNVDAIFAAMLDDTNTTDVFKKWYAMVQDGTKDRYALLERFFTMCAMDNDQVHTVRFYSAAASSSPQGTPLDWLADKQPAALATDTDDGGDDWASENRMTWYIRANALTKPDSSMNILAIEGEPEFDITGSIAPVYTFQLANWYKQEVNKNYEIYSWRATRAPGYRPFFGDVAPDGNKRVMTWHPTFCGSLTDDGKLTSGAGRRGANYTDYNTVIAAVRKWDGGLEGLQTNCDDLFYLREWQHRHFSKSMYNVLNGCTNYNRQYKVALAESNTTRVLLTTDEGAYFIKGSNVIVGDVGENSDWSRINEYTYNLSGYAVKIVDINNVEINEQQYTELVLDLSAPITTTATTVVSTVSWNTGETEKIIGHRDGAPVSLTNAKYPCRVAGIELFIGLYEYGVDPLYEYTLGTDGVTLDMKAYLCGNAAKQSNVVTEDYVDTGLSVTGLPQSQWQYLQDIVLTDKPVIFPKTFGGEQTQYYSSAWWQNTGVRTASMRAGLTSYDRAGIITCDSFPLNSSSSADSPRLGGAGKTRGEWNGN